MSGPGATRSEPSRAAHEAAERAKVAARESVTWLRDEAGRLHANYSKQSKYFKWRSWIVGAYALIGVVSLATVYGRTSNPIKAEVAFVPGPDNSHLIVHVENNSPDEWTHVRLILNSDWVFEKDRIFSQSSIGPYADQFHRKGGKPTDAPPANIVPKSLRVTCDQGSFTQYTE